MKYKIKAYNIWELGQRDNQEDSIFPGYQEITDTDRLFILCDGMGGHSSGEVASQTVCQSMSESIFNQCPDAEGDFSDEIFKQALSDTFDALDQKDNGAEKKMGTTLTFLKLHNEGCTIAHIGDSRVYHVRPGQTAEDTEILFQTVDHSLVNDLVRIGELTPEEAKHSNQKNVITRAMQPLMERRPRADLYHSHDIKAGDYFMLCSDGILENFEDENIKYIFSKKGGDDSNKVKMIINATEHNHDNHSAIIIHITDVIDPIITKTKETTQREKPVLQMGKIEGSTRTGVPPTPPRQPQKTKKKAKNNNGWLLLIFLGLICCWFGYEHFYGGKEAQGTQETQETPNREPIKPENKKPNNTKKETAGGSTTGGQNKNEKTAVEEPSAPQPAKQSAEQQTAEQQTEEQQTEEQQTEEGLSGKVPNAVKEHLEESSVSSVADNAEDFLKKTSTNPQN